MSLAENIDAVEQSAGEIERIMADIGTRARAAMPALAKADTASKNRALSAAAAAMRARQQDILDANAKDMAYGRDKGLSDAMLDRLALSEARVEDMARGVEAIVELADPVGSIIAEWQQPNGLAISRVRTPLGVIGIIYESRPNVTADAGTLCLKSGNAAILRGGSESFHSSGMIHQCLQAGLAAAGLPQDAIQLVPTRDRAAVGAMLTMVDKIDIIVPRGGKGLVARVQEESRVPVIAHLEGLCHIYVDGDADLQMARDISLNAKLRRTGICGSSETLLVDAKVADSHLPALITDLLEAGCEVRGDAAVQAVDDRVIAASEEDWETEYLDAIISARVVDGVDAAMAHIAQHGSNHTEAIITSNSATAEKFLEQVDSAIVMWNASTQYADGGEFGMGAEIGISTNRLHARGPVGLEQLCTFKYQVRGSGQVRP